MRMSGTARRGRKRDSARGPGCRTCTRARCQNRVHDRRSRPDLSAAGRSGVTGTRRPEPPDRIRSGRSAVATIRVDPDRHVPDHDAARRSAGTRDPAGSGRAGRSATSGRSSPPICWPALIAGGVAFGRPVRQRRHPLQPPVRAVHRPAAADAAGVAGAEPRVRAPVPVRRHRRVPAGAPGRSGADRDDRDRLVRASTSVWPAATSCSRCRWRPRSRSVPASRCASTCTTGGPGANACAG